MTQSPEVSQIFTRIRCFTTYNVNSICWCCWWAMRHLSQYTNTNTNSQIQTQVADICEAYQLSQCHHNSLSIQLLTPQVNTTVTTAGVTSQHIYIKHLLPTSTSSSDKVFPSCCFHNDTRVTDNGSYLVAVSWVSPQLISLGWIDVDVTKRACDMISHICCSMHQDIHKLLENLSGQSTILVW